MFASSMLALAGCGELVGFEHVHLERHQFQLRSCGVYRVPG